MKRLLYILAVVCLSLSAFGTDRPIACGDASGLLAAITAANPGDTITIVSNSGAQCALTFSSWNLPKKTISHPSDEAVLTATVSGGSLTGCSVSSGGAAYTITPSVRIVGGGGFGATAHVTISAGSVNSCVVDSGGSQYWGRPSIIPVSAENYITIRTSATSSLPPAGRRYQIANHATISPKITFTSTSPITIDGPSSFGLFDGAAYWKIQGLEMTFSNAGQASIFAALAGGSHIIFEQNYIYPQPCPNSTPPYNTNGRIAFSVTSYDVQINDNYVDCFWGTPPGAVAGSTGSDSMAVLSDTYSEGMTIDNNYLTGWFNGVFLGGGDPPPSATGHAAISSRAAGSATLASPPTSVPLIALELPFEGNTVAISSIARSSNVVTVVTSGAHGFLSGAYVYPKGVTDSSFNVTYDGTGAANCTVRNDTGCRLITVTNSTTFTYVQTGANASSSGGVIVPTTCQRGPGFQCFMDTVVSSISTNTVNFSHGYVGAFAWGTWDVIATVPNLLVKSGGDARWAGPQPTNVDITRNQLQRNATFDTWVVANNGNVGKGCPGEFKIWNGGRMEGNTCAGFPLNTPAFNGNSQYGSAPWVTISNITITNNWWQRFIGSFFTNFEYEPLTPGNRVDVVNNLWMIPDNNNASLAGENVKVFSGPSNYSNFNYKHNTVLTGFPFTSYPCTTTGASGDCYTTLFGQMPSISEQPVLVTPTSTIQDNIIGVGNYGYQCGLNGNLPVSSCTSLTENHNLLVSNSDGTCVLGATCGWTAGAFPWTASTNATPAGQPAFCGSYPCMAPTWASVQMNNPQSFDFSLKTASPGYRKASDGTDIGANYAAINAALGPDNPQLNVGTVTVAISPKIATIPVLGSQQFSATGATFTKNSGCLGSIGATNGTYTATNTPETCTITATLGTASDTATVTAANLTVSPASTVVNVGAVQQYTANFPVIWSISAGGGTIDSSGRYVAPQINGTYTVTGTAINGSKTATASVTVTGQQSFLPLTTSPTSWTTSAQINVTRTQVFTVSNVGTGTVTPSVTLAGASAYTITANTCTGALIGLSNCSVTVRFLSAAIGSFNATLKITDTAGGTQNIALNGTATGTGSFLISPATATIPVNSTLQLTATQPAYYTTDSGLIDASGLFTAPATPQLSTVTGTQYAVISTNLQSQTAWLTCGNCGDSGGPNGQPNGTFTFTAGNPATFSAQGNYPFNNGFWYYRLGAAGDFNGVTDYMLSFDMQFPTQADKNASQAVEFELQQNYLDHQYSMAWQICYACGNKLRVFNKTGHFWEDTGITFDPAIFAGGKWVTVLTTYKLTVGSNTRHLAIALNGVNHVVNIDHAPTPAVESDYLHPAFQLDSNSGNPPTPYSVKVRNFNIGTYTSNTTTAAITSINSNKVSPATVNLPVSGVQVFNSQVSSSWSVGCGTFTGTGTTISYTAPATPNNCQIQAVGGGVTGSAVANVSALAVSPLSVTLQTNSTQQFTVNFPSTWAVTSGSCTITTAGVLTAPSSNGSCIVRATAQNGGTTATASVSVVGAPIQAQGTTMVGGTAAGVTIH
jgi:hypothetical protein